LVEKSILTPEEALQIKKESVVVSATENTSAKILSFSSRLRTQYFMISADDGSTSDTISALQLRRVYLGTDATFSDTLKANITLDLLSATSSTHKLVKLYVGKKFDVDFAYGVVKAGFLADNFSYEALSTSKSLLTIERSIASRYFAG
jgi:phosphate-selective porin